MRRRLLKQQRIRTQKTFRSIFRNGRFVRGKSLNLWVCGKPEKPAASRKTAVGIMVSKKVSPLAVKRNRVRRKIREAFRLGQNQMPENSYLLIQAKEQMEKSGPGDILTELLNLIKKSEK